MKRWTLLFVAALAGCEQSPLDERADELREAQALWDQHGVPSYSYQLRFGCFCPPEVVRPKIVTVVNGVTTSMVYADSGTAVPPGMHAGLQTVDQLFARIDSTIAGQPVSLTVQYDPSRGFPTSIVVDQDHRMADDEWHVTVSAFQVLP